MADSIPLGITTSYDLYNMVADRLPDFDALGLISMENCRETMHQMGLTRYETLTSDHLNVICWLIEHARQYDVFYVVFLPVEVSLTSLDAAMVSRGVSTCVRDERMVYATSLETCVHILNLLYPGGSVQLHDGNPSGWFVHPGGSFPILREFTDRYRTQP